MDDSEGEPCYVCTRSGTRMQAGIESLLSRRRHIDCLAWIWASTPDDEATTDVQYLVGFLKNNHKGRQIRSIVFCPDEEGQVLPEKAQKLLGEFFASPDCRIEKVKLNCATNGSATDILQVLAGYLPPSNTSIRKLEFSNFSFESKENTALIRQLLVEKQDFESIKFTSCKIDPHNNAVPLLVDGLKVQKHLSHFCCEWDDYNDSENWSKILGDGIAPISTHSLSELEVFFPCPGLSEASLPKGLLDVLGMPDCTVRRLRFPRFMFADGRGNHVIQEKYDQLFNYQCLQVSEIIRKTGNVFLKGVSLKESYWNRSFISPLDEGELEMLCRRNKFYAEAQALFIRSLAPKKEEYAEFLVELRDQTDEVGLLPIFAVVRGKPDLVSNSFFKCFAGLLTQNG